MSRLRDMHSRCDLCGATLQPGDVQPELLCVRCSSCHGIYGLLRSDAEELLGRPATPPPASTPEPLDSRWTVSREGEVLRLSWSWYEPSIWVMVIACLVFASLGVGGLLDMVKFKGNTSGQDGGLMMLGMSLISGYVCLLSLVNRTSITASRQTGLEVRHGPLPSFHLSRTLEMRDIRQLYGKHHPHPRRDREFYELRVLLADGSNKRLLSNRHTAEQVLFLERMLEDHLGVRDQPVPGEFKPGPRG